MIPEQRIMITNTMRSGSSLITNALSVHSKILILSDNIHFFRFMFRKCEPLNEKNVHKMLLHQKARLFHRFKVEIDAEEILNNIKMREFSYTAIYDETMSYCLKKTGKVIWGDAPALQWREISDFLKLFPKGKVIHYYRDPRGVISSWKKYCRSPNNGYINSIFNWIDSLNYLQRYSETLSPESYMTVKFESLAKDPESEMKRICNFLEVPFEKTLIEPDRWEDFIGNNFVPIAHSAHEGERVVGYSPERTEHWKEKIDEIDVCLVEFLTKDKLEKCGYKLFNDKYSISTIKEGFERIRNNPFLLKQLYVFLATGAGTDKYPDDPTDPKGWADPNDKSKWFLGSDSGAEYLKEIEHIKEFIENKY